jgi:hypothetical protein
MLRAIYLLLLNLHPGNFRLRFGAEMLDILEDARGLAGRILLIGDGRDCRSRFGGDRSRPHWSSHRPPRPLAGHIGGRLPSASGTIVRGETMNPRC